MAKAIMEMAMKTATPRMICDMDAPSLGTTVATKRFKPKWGKHSNEDSR
jgi:hypothetical protein